MSCIHLVTLPCQSNLGQPLPLVAAQQHPHVHSVLQSRGQFAHATCACGCVYFCMHVCGVFMSVCVSMSENVRL